MVEFKIVIQAEDKSGATVTSVEDAFEQLFSGLREDADKISTKFEEVGDKIADSFSGLEEKISDAVGAGSGDVPSGVGGIGGILLKGISSVPSIMLRSLQATAGVIKSVIGTAADGIIAVFSGAFRAVISIGGSILSGLGNVVGFALSGLGSILDTVLLTPFRLVFNKITALAATVAAGAGFKFAADFQDSLSVAFALIPDEITPSLREGMQRTLENIRADTGASGRELGRALFTSISTGFGEASPILVGAAAKLAAVGESADDVASTTHVMTGILRAYNMTAKDAIKLADMLQQTQKLGNITNAELASQLGRVINAAKGAGVGLSELLASVSLATVKGATAEQAFTGLLGAITALSAPTPEAAKYLKELGVVLHTDTGEFIGLYEAIKKIASLDLDIQSLRRVLPERMARGFFQAISGSIDKYKEFIKEVDAASGVLDESLAERGRSISRQMERIFGGVANIFSTILLSIDEDVAGVFGRVADLLGAITNKLREMKDEGKLDELREDVSHIWEGFKGMLPTLEELRGLHRDILEIGVTTWNAVSNEFEVLKKGITDFVRGDEADFSNSILITSFQLGFEYIKMYAAKAVDFIRSKLSMILDSELAQAIVEKFDLIWERIGVKTLLFWEELKTKLSMKTIEIGIGIAKVFERFPILSGDKYREARIELERTLELLQVSAQYTDVGAAAYDKSFLERMGKALPLGAITYDSGTMEELKDRLAELIESAGAGAPEAAEKIAGAIEKPIAEVAGVIQEIVDTAGEGTDTVAEETARIRSLIGVHQAEASELKSLIRENSSAQMKYVTAQGELNQDIVEHTRDLTALLHEQQSKIKQLQESL